MSSEVLFDAQGHLGIITLNRPDALNALNLPMILAMQKQLSAWKQDHSIHAVVIKAASGKAFCAGGDVRWLYHAGKSHNPEQMQFFWHEYRLNHFIHHLGKPYISLMDGMTMGGGVGVSLHGSHPVVSERFVFAMPETAIGFFPDIGASHLLNQCIGSVGVYLALTGNRLGAEDAKKAGLVRAIVASEHMPNLLQDLIQSDLAVDAVSKVDACIRKFESEQLVQEYSAINPLIDVCFSQPSIELIFSSLLSSNEDWAQDLAQSLSKKSPLSLKITLEQLNKTRNLSLAECLKIDYDLVGHFMKGKDFYEGVRALLIDKDQQPQWDPADLQLVSDDLLITYFERSGSGLQF